MSQKHMRGVFAASLISLLLSTSLSHDALAHGRSHGSTSNNAGPIHTETADTLGAGRWAASLREDFINIDRFSDAELIERAGQHIHVHGMDYMSVTTIAASYGVRDNWEIGVSLPYIRKDTIRAGHHSHGPGGDTVEDHGDSYGFGDVTVLTKYRLPWQVAGIETAISGGVKLPTGKTDVSYAGERLDTEFQPGSGSLDPIVGVAFSKDFGRFGVDASLSHLWAGNGSQDTDLGNRFSYGFAGSYSVNERYALALEFNGEHAQQQKSNGVQDSATGGHELFLSPGVRYTAPSGWGGHLSFSVPVISNPNAGEPETDYKISTGVGISF